MKNALLFVFALIAAYLICSFVPYGWAIVIAMWTYHNHSLRVEREKRDDEVESLHDKIHELTAPNWR